MSRLLIVEDEAHSAEALVYYFGDRGWEVRTARSAGEALRAAEGFSPEVLLTDVVLVGEGDGLSVARELQTRDVGLPVVVMSGLPEHEVRERAHGVEVFEICGKPLRLGHVGEVVQSALESRVSGGG